MIIKKIDVFRYQLPLKKPIQIKQQTLIHREGLIICIKDEKDNSGFGEIAPLPGLSNESIEDTIKELFVFQKDYLEKSVPRNIEKLNGAFSSWFESLKTSPSVRFGLESATLNLLAVKNNIPLHLLLAKDHKFKVCVNALIDRDEEELLKKVRAKINEGYRSIKLKIGWKSIDQDIQLVNKIFKAIDGNARLRLDANQAWNFDEAVYFARGISGCTIEYVEEPLKETGLLPDLFEKTQLSIALDESLSYFSYGIDKLAFWIEALVLKPSIIGGLEKSMNLVRFAQKAKKTAVISDTFQSGIGLHTLICLASVISSKTAMGLDTYSWLSEDILRTRINMKRGTIDIQQISKNYKSIDVSRMQYINNHKIKEGKF